MPIRRWLVVLAPPALALVAALPALGQPPASLKLLTPLDPGGTWDQTGRAIYETVRVEKLFGGPVLQMVRAGEDGLPWLAEFLSMKGDGKVLLTLGPGALGAVLRSDAPAGLDSATPIARLSWDPLIVVVTAGSTFRSVRDLTEALKKDPRAVTLGGGAQGGAGHLLAALLAEAIGVPGSRLSYVASAGDREAVAALLTGRVAAAISSYAAVRASLDGGKLRALAISAPARPEGTSAPTLSEAGLDVDVANWSALLAPAGLAAADQRALVDLVDRMVKSAAWKEHLRRRNVQDAYLAGEAFAVFLKAESGRIARALRSLGLIK